MAERWIYTGRGNRENVAGVNANFEYLWDNDTRLEGLIQKAYDKAQSSYELWLEEGNKGTIEDYFNSLKVKGDPFTFEDFTPEQIESLKVKGDPFTFEDFTPEQIEALKVKGDPFTYEDFTTQQLEALKVKGDTGESAYELWLKEPGNSGKSLQEYLASLKGEKGDGLQIDGVVATVGELPTGTTKSTYLVGTTLYFRQEGNTEWTKGVDIKGVDGEPGSVITIVDGYWAIDGVKTSTLADVTKWSHTHGITDITGLQTALNGKAPITHTHAINDVTGLQSALDGKLTKSTADTLYAPIGSTGGTGGTTVADDKNKVNVNTKFGFVGDGITDNYQAFKDMIAFNKLNPEVKLEFDGQYNGQRAKYRVDRYVTIANIEGSYASGSPTHMVWEGRMVHLITNGALFINMPNAGFTKTKAFTSGGWHYAKEEPITLFNFEKVQSVIGDNLHIDGENYKLKFQSGFTSKEGENAKWSADNLPLAEGRGHGIILSGSTNISFKNISAINQVVDGIAMGFYADYTKMEVTQSSNVSITNVTTNGNGRLGISGLGACAGHITNFISEYNGMNKNADGMYISSSPAAGFDFEPHHSPISTDNTTPPSYKVEDWNGNFVIENARIRYNSGTQIACTSTLLTRNVVIQRATVRPPKGRTGDHLLIQASLQNCKFIDCDIDGKLADGKLSRVVFYGAGYVSESTGVITGQPANVWSEVVGGRWANVEPWVNTDGNTTYNEIPTGQYGLHNISFTGLVMDNVLFTLRTIRRFNFLNVVMNYPSDSVVNKLIIWNANMKDVVMINRKSSNITLDLGSGDTQSNFENLRLTSNKFDFASGTKKYKTAVISNEAMDVYDYTRAMEYILGNGTTPTPPADTTPPNPPTVNTVYTDATTITGTAEANSTITVLFDGGNATTATTNSSGSWTVTKPSAVTLTAGMSINVTAKDASNNVSSATTVTVQAVQTGTGGNLWPTTSFDFTGKTIPQAGGSGSKLVVNPVFTVSNNEAQALDMSGSGDTITFASKAGTSKYGIFTLEPNKQYTIRVKATDTIANASDLVTMFSTTDANYIWPNPKVVDITFTTGSDGKFGYDFNGVTYGGATSSFVFHRANGGKDSTTTYKIWLNPGATSTATWNS